MAPPINACEVGVGVGVARSGVRVGVARSGVGVGVARSGVAVGTSPNNPGIPVGAGVDSGVGKSSEPGAGVSGKPLVGGVGVSGKPSKPEWVGCWC